MSLTDSIWERETITKNFILESENNQDQLYVTLFQNCIIEPDFEINFYLENEKSEMEDNSKSWKVHRGFLKKSEYFRTNFHVSMNKSKFIDENFLKMEWVDEKHISAMDEIIKYFYQTKMNVKVEDFVYAYQICDFLKISALMKKMLGNINTTNAIDLLVQCLDIKKKVVRGEMRNFGIPNIYIEDSILQGEFDGSIDEYLIQLIINDLPIVLASPISEFFRIYDPAVFLRIIEEYKDGFGAESSMKLMVQGQFNRWLKENSKAITKEVLLRILRLLDSDFIAKDDVNLPIFCHLEDKFGLIDHLSNTVEILTSQFSKISQEDLSTIPIKILEKVVANIPQFETSEATSDKLFLVVFNLLDGMNNEKRQQTKKLSDEKDSEEEGNREEERDAKSKKRRLLGMLKSCGNFKTISGATMIKMIKRDDIPVELLKRAMIDKIMWYESKFLESPRGSEDMKEEEEEEGESSIGEDVGEDYLEVWDGPGIVGKVGANYKPNMTLPKLSIITRFNKRIPNHGISGLLPIPKNF